MGALETRSPWEEARNLNSLGSYFFSFPLFVGISRRGNIRRPASGKINRHDVGILINYDEIRRKKIMETWNQK